jgi:hypothetical protein
MECFENYRSDNPECRACWLRECCRFKTNEREQMVLNEAKSRRVAFLHFDGEALAELKVGYNMRLAEFF